MKIVILATGKTEEHESEYAARLIEQGRAVLAPKEKAAPRKARKGEDRPAPAPSPEKE